MIVRLDIIEIYLLIREFNEIILNYFLNLLSLAQRSCHEHLSGSRQAALHPGGVGQEDPSLL